LLKASKLTAIWHLHCSRHLSQQWWCQYVVLCYVEKLFCSVHAFSP